MDTVETTSEARTEQSPPAFAFRFALRTDVGMRRTENQDSHGYVRSRNAALFVIADGMGGARGGATASAIAIDVIAKAAVDSSAKFDEVLLRQAIERANRTIFNHAREDELLTGMGTTIITLAFSESQTLIAHVGDSRIYRLREGKFDRLTRDHTLVQELLESGAISADQAENHPIGHMLTRSLGPSGSVEVEVHVLDESTKVGDKFLLCSDGLYNMVTEEEIGRIVGERDPESAASQLVRLANERGGTDNITIEIIEVCAFGTIPNDITEFEVEVFTSADLENVEEGGESDNSEMLVNGAHVNGASVEASAQASEQTLPPSESEIEEKTDEESTQATSEAGAEGAADDVDEFVAADEVFQGADTAPLNEADEQEIAQLKKIQYGAIAAIVLTVAVIVFLLFPSRPDTSLPKESRQIAKNSLDVSSAGTEEPVESGGVPTTTEPFEVETPDVETAPPSEVVPQDKEEVSSAAIEEPVIIDTPPTEAVVVPPPVASVAVSSIASAVASSAASEALSTEKSISAEPIDVPPVKEVAPSTWPQATIVAKGTDPNLEVLAVPQTTLKDDPTQKDYELPSGSQKISKVIADAADISIPPPPFSQPMGFGGNENAPIVWEHEKIALEKAAAASQKAATQTTPSSAASGLTKSDQEKKSLAAQKYDARERIAAIDTKLRLFSLRDSAEAAKRLAEIDQDLTEIDRAIEQTAKNVETAKRRYDVWQARKDVSITGDAMRLADEVAISSVQVKRKKEAHDVASMRYLDAVEVWRENPSDNAATSNMAAFGKELKLRRAELEEAIVQAVNTSFDQAKFDIAEFATVRADLERRKDRLNRHAGFYKAYAVQVSGDRVARQRELLDERTKAVAQLEGLKGKFSDEEELQYRREMALQKQNVKH